MRDLRHAVRVLLKSPVFAIVAILTLAMCIGANTAIYTVVDRMLLRPLRYPHPERLAMVVREYRSNRVNADDGGQAGVTWEALKRGATGALDFAAITGGFSNGVNLVAGGRPEYVRQQRISTNYFRVLGVALAVGREFNDDEDRVNGPAATILSHGLWVRMFNADPSVVGGSVTLRGEPHTIVGVAPASLATQTTVDLWTPARPSTTGEGGGENYEIVARVKDGVAWSEADAIVAAATDAVVRDRYRPDLGHVRIGIVPLQRGEAHDVREPLVVLWAAVGVVLLIGCVNIAGLLVARGSSRTTEIAMRLALGAGRATVVRQLLAESVVLAACGGALGIAIGSIATRLLASLLEDAFGVAGQMTLDVRVFAIMASVALGTSVAFGLLPSLHASRVDLRRTLVESGSGLIAGAARRWPRRLLVVTEVALSVMLLVGAGLLVRSFDHLMRLKAGFDGTHVMTATLSLQDARYRSADRVHLLLDRTLERMRAIAGVEHAAAALTLPYERALNIGARWVAAKPGAEVIPIMNMTYVTPDYFDTLRIPILRGRAFTAADSAAAGPVIVVNEAFVRRSSPDQDPIGRQITSGGIARTVVGVVGDIQQKAGWGNFGPVAAVPASYIPAAQTNDAFVRMVHNWFAPSWFVRTSAPRQDVVAEMQQAVQAVDPMLPFAKFRTLDDVRAEAVATQRAQTMLLGALAFLAVALAAIGLYGLVANSVAERTRELGIRIALGATSSRAVAAAAAPGIALALVGVGIGLVAARFGVQTLRHLVWGVSVADPVTFVLAGAVVFTVAIAAALVPAFRIVRLNPIKALRQA
jgi:predicted permease